MSAGKIVGNHWKRCDLRARGLQCSGGVHTGDCFVGALVGLESDECHSKHVNWPNCDLSPSEPISFFPVFITFIIHISWEFNEIAFNKYRPKSFLPNHLQSNLDYALKLKPDAIFLWGYEYWLWKKLKGDDEYWNKAKELIDNFKP